MILKGKQYNLHVLEHYAKRLPGSIRSSFNYHAENVYSGGRHVLVLDVRCAHSLSQRLARAILGALEGGKSIFEVREMLSVDDNLLDAEQRLLGKLPFSFSKAEPL